MEEIVFAAERREVIGKQVKALRRAGRLPAVLYGHRIEPIAVTLDSREANRILPTITSSHLVVIDLNGDRHTAIVREKQYNYVLGTIIHVDFNVVSMTEKLRAKVSIHLDGEAPAVKNLDGVVVSGLEELEVECLPADLPERIVVDISGLNEIGDAIYVRDITLSSKVDVLTDLDELLVVVTAPKVEVEEVEEAEVEPEVIEKGKIEEEEEEEG